MFISLSIRLARVFRFIIFLRRRLMYTRHRRGWTLTRVCSYIPLSHQHFLLHLSSFSPNCNLPHSAIAVARIHSPPPSLTQERHYSSNLVIMISPPVFYPFRFPLDLAFVIRRLESKQVPVFLFRYAPSLLISQSCISTWDCFLLSLLLSVKAAHRRRVSRICSLVGCIWTYGAGNLSNVRTLNSLGLITFLDAMDVYIRFFISKITPPFRMSDIQSLHEILTFEWNRGR